MKICLFGGTFDPPHIGHLLIAQTVCEAENFDKILFMPAYSCINIDENARIFLEIVSNTVGFKR